MDFVIGLPISINEEGETYHSILVIVNELTKMIHYKPVKITINDPGLTKVIIGMIMRYHGFPDLIVTD